MDFTWLKDMYEATPKKTIIVLAIIGLVAYSVMFGNPFV